MVKRLKPKWSGQSHSPPGASKAAGLHPCHGLWGTSPARTCSCCTAAGCSWAGQKKKEEKTKKKQKRKISGGVRQEWDFCSSVAVWQQKQFLEGEGAWGKRGRWSHSSAACLSFPVCENQLTRSTWFCSMFWKPKRLCNGNILNGSTVNCFSAGNAKQDHQVMPMSLQSTDGQI